MTIADARIAARARMKQLAQANKDKLEAEAVRNRAISQAWDAWIASEEGERCATEPGAYGEYLRNRLWRAFIAGAGVAPVAGREP